MVFSLGDAVQKSRLLLFASSKIMMPVRRKNEEKHSTITLYTFEGVVFSLGDAVQKSSVSVFASF